MKSGLWSRRVALLNCLLIVIAVPSAAQTTTTRTTEVQSVQLGNSCNTLSLVAACEPDLLNKCRAWGDSAPCQYGADGLAEVVPPHSTDIDLNHNPFIDECEPTVTCTSTCAIECYDFPPSMCEYPNRTVCNGYCCGTCVNLAPGCIACASYDCGGDGGGGEDDGDGGPGSPILISTQNGAYDLTSWETGVLFDLNGDAVAELTAWTSEASDDAFLVFDRDGNGLIDDFREVFGDLTMQPPSAEPNGFLALAVFDDEAWGGNDDGALSGEDFVFSLLQLWFDWNHNGISEPEELSPLSDSVFAIDLDYSRHPRVDSHGNEFRFRTKAYLTRGNVRHAYDVFFVPAP